MWHNRRKNSAFKRKRLLEPHFFHGFKPKYQNAKAPLERGSEVLHLLVRKVTLG